MYRVIETAEDGREVWRQSCPTRESAEEYVTLYGRLVARLFLVDPAPDGGLIVTSETLGDKFHVRIVEEEANNAG